MDSALPACLRSRTIVALACAALTAETGAGASGLARASAQALPERLASHPALVGREFAAHVGAPFALYVERSESDLGESAREIAALVLPALAALSRELSVVLDDVEVPEPPVPIILCADPLTQRWFLLANRASFAAAAASDCEPRLGAVVRSFDAVRSEHAPEEVLRPLLRDACTAVLVARAGGPPASPWLARGLAVHLAERALGVPLPIEERRMKELRALLADLPRRIAWWDTLPAVLAASTLDAYPALHAEAKNWPDVSASDVATARVTFELQAALFVAYLLEGARPEVVERMPAVAGAALTEHVDALGLLERLEVEEFAALELGLEGWLDVVLAQRAGLAPAATLSPTAVMPEPDELERGHRMGLATDFDGARLVAAPATFDEFAAEALWLGGVGRLTDAAIVLELAALRAGDDEARQYLLRERARMLSLTEARAALLRHALSGGRVRLPIDGRQVDTRVSALAGAALQLVSPVAGCTAVPLTALDARVLGRNLARADVRGIAPGWIAGYALLLAGERGWKDHVRDEVEGRSLLLDARVVELLRARAAERGPALALAASSFPRDAAELEHTLAAIAALAPGRRPLTPAPQRMSAVQLGPLSDLAQRCLERRYADADVHALLAGSSEALTDGVVRVTYEFDDAGELDDFDVDLDPAALPPTTGQAMRGQCYPQPSPLAPRDFELALTGRVELRHCLELAPPCRLRVELREPEYEGGAVLARAHTVRLAMLDGGEFGPTVCAVDRSGLVVRQGPIRSVSLPAQPPFPSGAERVIELTATLDGAIRSTLDGHEVQRIDTPELEPGATRLLCRTPFTWALRRVVIEGRPLPASVELLRARVVARELERLGL